MARDIAKWLSDLGLGKHAEAFALHEIDKDALTHLTSEDLKEMGLPIGPRRKVLAAINDLKAKADPAAPSILDEIESERRQVTVLFADLSGFTALSRELDVEETHALLNRFFDAADAVVERYGGRIDKHIGDAVMAVFGAPIAHGDDPERAVRAALDMHDAVAALDPPLEIHIGIASGQVVADRTGSDAHREYTVTGDSVNLASRLTDIAARGETLISEAAQRTLSGRRSKSSVRPPGWQTTTCKSAALGSALPRRCALPIVPMTLSTRWTEPKPGRKRAVSLRYWPKSISCAAIFSSTLAGSTTAGTSTKLRSPMPNGQGRSWPKSRPWGA